MIIKFYNLGAIEETELDLRPLTVIIGPNNSNKTYIAYSVYGLWQHGRNSINGFPSINFRAEGQNRVANIDKAFMAKVSNYADLKSGSFASTLGTFYQDASGKLFADTRFEVRFSEDEILQSLQQLNNRTARVFEGSPEYRWNYHDNTLVASPVQPDEVIKTPSEWPYYVEVGFQLEFLKLLFAQPYLLPAERNSFIITYKMLLNKRFSLLRDRERQFFGKREDQEFQQKLLREQGDIRYPQPIEDFLDFLSAVELSHGQTAAVKSIHGNSLRNGTEINPFLEVASQIEKYIQGGNKTTFSPTTLGGSEIMVNVKKGLSIDLYNASSSIKQLTPLLLYLRYRAAENQLLIIDEPEMNLHPESQVRLLEILAILVNAGVKVLLTTHSPYLMSHLNNLTLNDNHSDAIKKKQATSLYLKDPRAFLMMEQVSAYEMRDNQLKDLKDNDFGIRYDTLSDVSVDVQQKYFEIYEKGKPTKRGKAQTTGNGDVS